MNIIYIHHFANDTNLLHINKSPKMLNKLINYNLKNFSNFQTGLMPTKLR